MTVNSLKHMVCWESAHSKRESRGQIALVPHPGHGARRDLTSSIGACFADWHAMTPRERGEALKADALAIIIRDGLEPAAVHRVFSNFQEYRDALPEDMPYGDKG